MNAEDAAAPTPLRGRRTRAEFAPRMQRMRELIGYSAADELIVRGTREVVAAAAGDISARVYERMLAHPETRVYFARPDGAADAGHVAMRADSLSAWLRMAMDTPPGEDLAAALSLIGRSHTKRGGSRDVRVNGRYLLGMMSVIASELTQVLTAALPADDALRAAGAWQRLLMIHLDMFLAVYGSAEGNPHWY